MAEHKRFVNLEKAMCHELETMDSKCAAGTELSDKDLDRADKMMHYLNSNETWQSMVEANAHDERYGGMSGTRYPRPRMMSRDYPEGWSPMEYIDPYYYRR